MSPDGCEMQNAEPSTSVTAPVSRGDVEPDVHIYTRSKLPWVALPESVPAFRTFYDPQKLWPAESLTRVATVTSKAR